MTERNDPCPCGSGKKYKQCCLNADEARSRSLRLVQGQEGPANREGEPVLVPIEALQAMDRDDTWELDAVPLAVSIGDEPGGRVCVRLLVVNGFVLDAFIDNAPSSEPEDVARDLLQWMREVVQRIRSKTGVNLPAPDVLRVRHASVAACLAPQLAPATRVEARVILPQLDDAARGMQASMDGREPIGGDGASPVADEMDERGLTLLSMPECWSAWNIDTASLRLLMDATARYYRAAPWTQLDDTEALQVQPLAGNDAGDAAPWTACILGAAGETFGLVLYEVESDYLRVFDGGDPYDLMRGLRGAVLTVYFDERAAIPRPMAQEFKRNGWEVAGIAAYPSLSCANTPAGGISSAQVRLLTNALDAVAALTSAQGVLAGAKTRLTDAFEWHHEATRLTLTYRGTRAPDRVRLWEVPAHFAPGKATGPAADASAIFPRALASDDELDARLQPELDRLERFRAWLAADKGERRRARAADSARTHFGNAQLFVEHLAFGHGVTVAALHEVHLRIFLYSWFPSRVSKASADATSLLQSLRHVFAWLETEGVTCPWAAPILADHASFDARLETAGLRSGGDGPPFWWYEQIDRDLHERALLPEPIALPDDSDDEDEPGEREDLLNDELMLLQLEWREGVIASGVTDAAEVRAACVTRKTAWESAPHVRYGKSPVAVIRQERRKAQRTRN